MLILRGTTDLIQLVTGAAADIEVMVSAMDASDAAPPVIQIIPNLGPLASIVTATTTTIVAAPGSTFVRNVKEISIYNNHASLSCPCTVQVTDGTNVANLWNGTLLAGELLIFDELGVWTLYGSDGVPKAPSTKIDRKLVVTADVTFATTATFADVTGLTTPLQSGKRYCFEAHLYHINNATTTGSQFGVNIGAAPTTLIIATIDTVTASVTASVHSAGSVTARDTAATAQTTGSVAVTMGILSGYIVPSADGTFAIRATSEVTVASGLIVKAGSWLRIWETDN